MKNLKKECLKDIYTNKTELYNLINNKYVKKLINQLDESQTKITSTLVHKKDYLEHYELFLYNLDYFISYFKTKFIIRNVEFEYILSIIFKSQYANVFLEKKFIHDNEDFDYFIIEFQKLITDYFIKNLTFFQYCFDDLFTKEKITANNLNIDTKNNLDKYFNLLKNIINCNRDNIYFMFEDPTNLDEKRNEVSHRLMVWKMALETYFTRKNYLKKLGL